MITSFDMQHSLSTADLNELLDMARAKGFVAGLEAGAEIVEIICERFGKDCKEPKLFRILSVGLTAAIRARAKEEKATP